MYYLQSRYYDPEVGRFVNGDEAAYLGVSGNVLGYNLFSYCENNPIMNVDIFGFWAENYSGFLWTSTGFNLNVQLYFLLRPFCISYANDIIRLKGQRYWWGKGYKKMSSAGIAQELWFHALVYYVGSPIKSILNTLSVSWSWLNSKLESARYMQINNDDNREWVFSLVWAAAYNVKTLVCLRIGYGYPYSYIHI